MTCSLSRNSATKSLQTDFAMLKSSVWLQLDTSCTAASLKPFRKPYNHHPQFAEISIKAWHRPWPLTAEMSLTKGAKEDDRTETALLIHQCSSGLAVYLWISLSWYLVVGSFPVNQSQVIMLFSSQGIIVVQSLSSMYRMDICCTKWTQAGGRVVKMVAGPVIVV